MSIVTRTGDNGQTGLFGGRRVHKSDARIHAYGTVDELNAVLGLILAEKNLKGALPDQLLHTQNMLFRLGADLATPMENNAATVPRITQQQIDDVETWINGLEAALPTLRHFILPGGSKEASLLHFARTVCRRAERWVAQMHRENQASAESLRYVNRLSDYLFLSAMQANIDAGVQDIAVNYE